MDLYTFTVEDFIIHDTRAVHNDTLRLSYTAYVDGDMVASRLISLGDFDNGEYSTIDYVPSDVGPSLGPVVINDPAAKCAFIFQLVNAGNVPEGALSGRVAATADQLAGITAGLAGAGAIDAGAALSSAAFPAGLLLEAFATLWSWLDTDCDGPVAVDQISGPRYVLDAWTDNPAKLVRTQQTYPGTDSPTGCGGNSNYEVIWSLLHARTWVQVAQAAVQFSSATGVSAAEHHGAVHGFGIGVGGSVNHTRTFTGATWLVDNLVDNLGPFNLLAGVAVTAVSFDGRLYVLGALADGSVSTLAYTVDGGSWVQHAAGPGSLQTAEPVAAAIFRDRLYVIARDSASGQLRLTSTADMRIWNPWTDVPPPGFPSGSAVAAAALGDKLYIFGVFDTGKAPASVIMRNSTSDGVTWSGWDQVEAGIRPEGAAAADQPLDVAAGIFHERIYLTSRWESTEGSAYETGYLTVNFSADGDDWSGWRIPQAESVFQASNAAGLAAVGSHLYILAPQWAGGPDNPTPVWAH
jgi:hypothetical protein